MDLPLALRRAVDQMLAGKPLGDIGAAAAALSRRYRQELRDGTLHVADERMALAYLAVRLPATYAALRASLAAVARSRPTFAPTTALDVGAGPGTALWAAADCWPDLADFLLIEASPVFRAYGERLAAAARPPRIAWRTADIAAESFDTAPRALVIIGYVLSELAPEVRQPVLARLWQATADMLVIVEPGTPAGWQRILAARDQLLAAGAHLVAPCPHTHACPLQAPDWCHFAARVARSRLHRTVKDVDVPWEDEKFIYLAVARQPGPPPDARVIAAPRRGSGRVTLKLCRPDGAAGERLFSRRDGDAFKQARRTDWGDTVRE